MKVIIDKDIPFIKGVLEPYGKVEYCKGSDIKAGEADALIIRTRTKCNAELLEGSKVKFIATATIGCDHIDLNYCALRGIEVACVPGCNSGAVMQYVFTALFELLNRKALKNDLKNPLPTFGIVGVGHVGGKVAALAKALGFKVLLNDPPKAAELPQCVDLQELLANSDIVTLHVPLDDTTRGLADERFFDSMKEGAIFINSCRGEVVEDEALIKYRAKLSGLICDVWRSEPNINRELLDIADIATPHIAGYSVEGKVNGTEGVIRAFGRHCGIEALKNYKIKLEDYELCKPHRLTYINTSYLDIYKQLIGFFSIMELDRRLRGAPSDFEKIRTGYKYRNEFYY